MKKALYDALCKDATVAEVAILDLWVSMEARLIRIEKLLQEADEDAPTYNGEAL